MKGKNKTLTEIVNLLLDSIKEELQEQDRSLGYFEVSIHDNAIEVICNYYDGKIIEMNLRPIYTTWNKPATNLTDKLRELLDADKNFKYINNY